MKFHQYYYCLDTSLLNMQNEEMLIDAPIKNQFFFVWKNPATPPIKKTANPIKI
jgi:hypothetical protein